MAVGELGLLRAAVVAAAMAMLGACAAEEEARPTDPETMAAAAKAEEEAEAQTLEQFEGTAWQVSAEDGARYVTYLDSEGRYRDLRNSEPWQEGVWTIQPPPEKDKGTALLCFKPDGDNVRERCWEAGQLRGSTLVVESGGGRRVELLKVAYEPPAADQPEE